MSTRQRRWSGMGAAVALGAILLVPASHSQTEQPRCHGKAATIVAPPGGLVVNGTAKADVIVGTAEDDFIRGQGGNDVICGGAGDDSLFGGAGKDTIYGDDGDDTLIGGAGRDKLKGGAGKDTCTEKKKARSC